MNKKVKIGSGGIVTINDKMYLAGGGEADIFVNSGMAFKLYHDPDHKMLPVQKMKELATIKNSQIVIPKDVIYDASSGKPLGYTTTFVSDVEPLVKFFTRTFKDDNNIDQSMINDLVKQMQMVTMDVHAASCLIVDYNELNVLIKIASNLVPWYIDTDSYSTPSFKATAIMDSIRDRTVSVTDKNGVLHYNPTYLSDWFSWGVLAFWLYSNIHPFRGNHKNYKPKDKKQQMDDGISVFHSGVRVPPSVNDFNLIPKRHLEWFKAVFGKGDRSIPPLPDSMAPVVTPSQIIIVTGNDKIDVIEILSYPDHVVHMSQFMGVNYVITKTHIYADKKEIHPIDKRKVLVCSASDGTMVSATLSGTKVHFNDLLTGVEFGSINSKDMFVRNGCIYTVSGGKVIENSFTCLGTKIIHRATEIENVSQFSATMYDGCIIQDLLGKKYLTLPYKKGSCFSKYIQALDGFRVVNAKSDKYVAIVLAEKSGIYHRFIIVFQKNYSSFEVREVKDVAFDEINFAVMENGLCILLASPTEMELFATADKYETLPDPPFDSTMKLLTTPDGFFFLNGNSVHQIKRK